MDFDGDVSSLYSIKGILILDQDGKRVITKYYDHTTFPTVKEQKAFELSLFKKSQRESGAEIVLLDGITCLYRFNVDLYFYVLGSMRENELSVLNGLYDAVSGLLRKNVEKKALIDAMDTTILIIDEICDEGIIMETDSQAILSRCSVRADEVSFVSDQSMTQMGSSLVSAVKDQFKWSLLK